MPAGRTARLLDEAHANPLGVPANNLAASFDFALISGKGAGHDHVAADIKAAFDLDVGAARTEILDDALEELAIGGKVGFNGTGFAGMQTGIAGLAGMTPKNWCRLRTSGLRHYSFYHVVTIYH